MTPHLISPDGGRAEHEKVGYLRAWGPLLVKGLFCAALLAVLLVICVRMGEIERGLSAKEANQAAQAANAAAGREMAKERYETEMREIHDLKVSLNTLTAWYQEDARNQYRNRR